MTSIQDKFFRQLDEAVQVRHHELVTKGAWANTGDGFIQPPDGFTTVSTFHYDFQDGTATFVINGVGLGDLRRGADEPEREDVGAGYRGDPRAGANRTTTQRQDGYRLTSSFTRVILSTL